MRVSGAIAGVIGAFAATYPNLIVAVPIPALVLMFFVRMKVWMGAILFTAMQLVFLAISGGNDGVAYFAHLGGLAAGGAFGWLLVHRFSPPTQRPATFDLGALASFARDGATSQALAHMKSNRDEPQVFEIWYERFLRTATCPTCSHKVMQRHRGQIVCTQGHSFDVRQGRRAASGA